MNDYYVNLPRKRMGAGALFFDKKGRLLIVKPSYKDHWSIPGGVVDKNESPKTACLREIREEIGLSIADVDFVSVKYNPDKEQKGENLQFIFNGGILSEDLVSKIQIDGKEIIDFTFLSISEAQTLLSPSDLAEGLPQLMDAIRKEKPMYVE